MNSIDWSSLLAVDSNLIQTAHVEPLNVFDIANPNKLLFRDRPRHDPTVNILPVVHKIKYTHCAQYQRSVTSDSSCTEASMSMLTMPLLITNLGCEMIYILQQRLLAQNIPQEKAVKVLHDVVKAMFETSFVSLLFTPQAPFTVQSTRTIFDKLAHSSIMRLSEAR